MFDRMLNLISEDTFNKIQNKNILVVGLGGVGGYAVETLIRSGIINITIVDGDKIELSNLNRQLITLESNLGEYKTDVCEKRVLEINHQVKIKKITKFINQDNFCELSLDEFDYVIDACDDIELKLFLIKNADKYKLISSMGTANKFDPQKLSITSLEKTIEDPLARILRKKVKELQIKNKFKVVSSKEVVYNKKNLGTISQVPSVAGILCASYVINDIIKSYENS